MLQAADSARDVFTFPTFFPVFTDRTGE